MGRDDVAVSVDQSILQVTVAVTKENHKAQRAFKIPPFKGGYSYDVVNGILQIDFHNVDC